MRDEELDGLTKAQHDLEWSRLVEAVAARCTGPLRETLEALEVHETYEAARVALVEAAEAAELLRLDEPLPLDGIRDVRRPLARLEKQGALDGTELRAIATTLGAARALRKFLARHRDRAPALHQACSTDPTLDRLVDELERAVESDGTLADTASPELGRLRTEVANLRARIVGRLEAMLLKHADIVQDRFHTLREGRYVIPVRTDAHEKLPGIVHGTSGSGATVFVEPKAIVNQGNRLKMAQGELEREEARILGILSGRVRDRGAEVSAAVDALDRADLRHAAARLSKDLGATIPKLSRAPRMRLIDARHPLLALEGVEVVANDLELEAGGALVMSGPNAGGKTVSLKVLGLAALMARAGLPVPANEGSEAGFFSPVLTDVGDEQSLQKNLSTFSAHVTNLVSVLHASGPSAMVLLDEIATGTDPHEGAALACALVDALCQKGAALAVTTHYERLKAMAVEDPRLRNASVGFDVARMAPTFVVRRDVPGSSSALAVAQRFGMPQGVLTRAKELLPDESRTFDALVQKLESRFEELESERAQAEAARREAERLRDEAALELERRRQRDHKKLSEEGARLMEQLRQARAQLKDARKALRKSERHDEAALRKIREQLDGVGAQVEGELKDVVVAPPAAPPKDVGTPVEASEVEVGQRVYVPRLRTEVDVVEAPSKGRVRVAAGPVKLWVKVDEIRKKDAPREAAKPTASAPSAAVSRSRAPASDNTLDVRGMRVDDAISMTESFLDRMFGASEALAYILHGVGSGALRDAIREHLGQHAGQYVRSVRPGTLEEGGERMTVVQLR